MLVPWLALQLALGVADECPDHARVEAGVREILGLSPEHAFDETFTIERTASGLSIVLLDAESNPLGERTLPGDDSCEALEGAAVAVISAWLGSAHPEFSVALPSTAPAEQPAAAPEPPLPPPPPPRVVAPPSPPPVLPPTPSLRRFEFGAGLGGALAPGSVVPAAFISLGFEPRASGFGARLALAFSLTHEQALATGSVHFRRLPLMLGPTLRWANRGLFLDVDVGPALAWLHVEGHSFENEKSADDIVPGAFAGIRLTFARPLAPFFAVTSLLWPGTSTVYAAGTNSEEPLPHWDGQLILGATIAP